MCGETFGHAAARPERAKSLPHSSRVHSSPPPPPMTHRASPSLQGAHHAPQLVFTPLHAPPPSSDRPLSPGRPVLRLPLRLRVLAAPDAVSWVGRREKEREKDGWVGVEERKKPRSLIFVSFLFFSPSSYRTQMCNDGLHCARRICFFAHSPAELRSGAPKPALPADAAAGLAADAAGRAARAGAAAAAAAHRAGGGSLPAGLGLGLGWGLPLSPTAGGAGRPSASLSFAPPRPAGPLSVSTSSEDSGGGCGCGSGGSGGSRTPAADAPSAPSRPRARGARGGARARAAAARAAAAAAGAGAKGGGGRPPFAVGSWDGGLGGSVWGWDGPDALRSASTSLGGLSLMSGGGCCGGGDGSLAAAADLAADLRSASLGAAPGPFFRSPPLRRSAFEAPRPLSAAVAAPPPGGRASWGGGNQQQWASGGGGGGGGGGPWQCLQTHNAHHTPHPLLGAPAAAPRPSRASADFPDAPDARSLDLVGAAALEAEASRRHSASLAGRGGVPPRHLSTRVTTPPSPSPPDADDGTAPVSLRLASLRLQVAMAEDEEARAALLEASGPPPRPGAAGGWGGARQYHPHPHPHPALVGAAAPAARPQPALASISLDEARRVRAFLAAGSVTGAAGGPAGGRG